MAWRGIFPREGAMEPERALGPFADPAQGGWRRFGPLGPRALAAALVLWLSLTDASWALTLEQRALQGLPGVYVVVEEINLDLEPLGLTSHRIRAEIEERLKKAGVKVLGRNESFNTPGKPYLYVRLNAPIRPEVPVCAFAIAVELRETVKTVRGLLVDADIWNTGASGSVGKDKIRQIRNSINDQIDQFINDYLEANQKP